jgi:glycerophosphoryl diester phosphodiesterase
MNPTHRPRRIAHRGGAGLAPENTLAAFRLGLAHEADAVELDLHMSQDGALVVMHDPDVRRMTGVPGEIGTLTLEALRRLNAAATYTGPPSAPQRVPTLQEVLELVRGRAEVQIDIKVRSDASRYRGIEAKVLETVRQYAMLEQVLILAFDIAVLREITALEPRVQTCALLGNAFLRRFGLRRDHDAVAEELAAQGFRCVGVKHTLMTPDLLRALRARAFRVGVWTVNEPEAMRRFADMGVDFLTSDRPDLLRHILR